jgi:hypothetical protein
LGENKEWLIHPGEATIARWARAGGPSLPHILGGHRRSAVHALLTSEPDPAELRRHAPILGKRVRSGARAGTRDTFPSTTEGPP